MRRSNSPGAPVSSACTGASKPSAAADFGTSCTCPSVSRMTPASRSAGVSESALLRSEKSCVPCVTPSLGRAPVTHFTSRLGMARELRLQFLADGGRLLGALGQRLAGAFVDHDDGDVGEAFALLFAQDGVGERGQAARPSAASRSAQPRLRRRASSTTSNSAEHARDPEKRTRQHRREIEGPAHCPSLSSNAGTCTWSAL